MVINKNAVELIMKVIKNIGNGTESSLTINNKTRLVFVVWLVRAVILFI